MLHLVNCSANQAVIVEAVSDSVFLHTEQDAVRIMEEMFAFGTRKLILHQEHLAPEFFDLKTGLAGAVLQKFTNYQIQVAIIGDFAGFSSRALQAFIFESNRGSHVFFVESLDQAVQRLSQGG